MIHQIELVGVIIGRRFVQAPRNKTLMDDGDNDYVSWPLYCNSVNIASSDVDAILMKVTFLMSINNNSISLNVKYSLKKKLVQMKL